MYFSILYAFPTSSLLHVQCTCIFIDDTPNLCIFYENNHWHCGSQFKQFQKKPGFMLYSFFYFLQGKCIDEMCKYVLHVRKGILLIVWQKAIDQQVKFFAGCGVYPSGYAQGALMSTKNKNSMGNQWKGKGCFLQMEKVQ